VVPPPDTIEAHLVSLIAPETFEAERYRMLAYIVEQLHTDAVFRLLPFQVHPLVRAKLSPPLILPVP
jgi:hypothetical protein